MVFMWSSVLSVQWMSQSYSKIALNSHHAGPIVSACTVWREARGCPDSQGPDLGHTCLDKEHKNKHLINLKLFLERVRSIKAT